jgi:hypothetical protein
VRVKIGEREKRGREVKGVITCVGCEIVGEYEELEYECCDVLYCD